MDYYSHVNVDLLKRIPAGLANILEVGCGRGKLAEAYLASNTETAYYGIELNSEAARDAAEVMTGVISGSIESDAVLGDLAEITGGVGFDAIILGDILEHLQDPWTTLGQLYELAGPGATCLACLPNVSHWSILKNLLAGKWDYEPTGLLDQTHLRFFTLRSARELFRQAGWKVAEEHPLVQGLNRDQQQQVLALLDLAKRLSLDPETAKKDLLAYQWILIGIKPD